MGLAEASVWMPLLLLLTGSGGGSVVVAVVVVVFMVYEEREVKGRGEIYKSSQVIMYLERSCFSRRASSYT